jgi:predicted naringenin-chalcone synthase
MTLRAERGTFPSDVATLSAEDPTLTFTAHPSSDPDSVSYAVGGDGFAAAVRSESGTCWWVRVAISGATSYGSGSSCTGAAAMAASDPTW